NAWLGLALGLGLFAAFGRNRNVIAALVGLSGIVFAIAYVSDIGNVPYRIHTLLGAPSEHRISLWLGAWEMFKESPVLGKGVHVFGEFYHPYLSRVTLPAGVVAEVGPVPWPHNLLMEVLAERGLAGLVGFLTPTLALASVLVQSWRGRPLNETRAIALGLTGSILVFLAMAQVDLTFLKDWVLLVYWLLAGLVARLPALTVAAAETQPGS